MSQYAALSGRTMKVSFDGDMRRMKLELAFNAAPSAVFSTIQMTILEAFGLPENSAAQMMLTYADDEEDMCTLTDVTIDDFATICPTGVLRLTLTLKAADFAKHTFHEVEPQPTAAHTEDSNAEAEMRELLTNLLQKMDPNMRDIIRGLLSSMDPKQLQGIVSMFLSCKGKGCGKSATDEVAEKIASLVKDMDPIALHALLQDILRNASSDSGTQSNPAPPNPLGAMLGALFSGKGCGKGGYEGSFESSGAPPPNPMHGLLGSMMAGKGAGKGDACGAGPQPNPMDFLNAFLGGKGCGKGNGGCGAPAPTAEATQQVHADAHAQAVAQAQQAHANAHAHVLAPPATISNANETDTAARETFQRSVNDLVEMGVVADPQIARQLLNVHGDISSVISVLT